RAPRAARLGKAAARLGKDARASAQTDLKEMSAMSGGSGTTTTVQQADPWSKQQPYLEQVFREAQRLYQQPGPYYYPGQTTASFSPESELAMTAQAARAMSGSPLSAASGQEILNTLGGQYLGVGNPYFSGMVGRI